MSALKNIEIDWNEVYEAVPKALKLSLNGVELELGKHYEIADIAHTADMAVIVCKGIEPYLTDEITVKMEIAAEGGKLYLQQTDKPLPENIIRIADRLYKVVRGSKPVNKEKNRVLGGFIKRDGQIIYIADDLSPELEQEVFIHEILHGCIELYTPEMRQRLSVEDEERFVNALAQGLAKTVNCNPEYFTSRKQKYVPVEIETIQFSDKEDIINDTSCNR